MNKLLSVLASCLIFIAISAGSAFAFYDAFQLNKKGLILGPRAYWSMPSGFYGDNLNPGYGFGFSAGYSFGWSFLFFETEFDYSMFSAQAQSDTRFTFLTLTAGPVLYMPWLGFIQPYIGASAGYTYGTFRASKMEETFSRYDPVYIGKVGFFIPIFTATALRVGAEYSYNAFDTEPFVQTRFIGSVMYRFGRTYPGVELAKRNSSVSVERVDIIDIFPAQYPVYNNTGIGEITVRNTGRRPVARVHVETEIGDLTDGVISSHQVDLNPGESRTIPVSVVFSENALEVSGKTEISAQLRVIYEDSKSEYYTVERRRVSVFDANALTWDKTIHIASFVMPKEPVISTYTRRVIAEYSSTIQPGISKKIQTASILFNAMAAQGLIYATDPSGSYANATSSKAIDFVQMPRETLSKRAGDCDDLTALYATMLESIGIHTAAVTIPGHIFMMFDTEEPVSADSARNADFVEYKRTLWVPVEVTMVGKRFSEAWKEGLKGYRSGGADVYEMEEAWKSFPPVNLAKGSNISLPDRDRVERFLKEENTAMIARYMKDPISRLESEVRSNPGDLKSLLKAGVIYGKFGQLDKAVQTFQSIIARSPDMMEAHMNLGNCHFLRKDFPKAEASYRRALNLRPSSSPARIGLSRALYELRRFDEAKAQYAQAKSDNPGYSRMYGYLEGNQSQRASEFSERLDQNIWATK